MANMFGALNRFIARLDSDPNAVPQGPNSTGQSSNSHYGFQVLRNTNDQIPLEPWFDFIIGINGHNIETSDPALFMTEVRNCAGSTISLGVYGAKGSQIREIYITVPPAEQVLGLALQWSPLSLVEDVWHILDVIPNSPADVAGLFAIYGGDGALGQLVEAYTDSALRLWVYNNEYNVTRMVTITPAKNWGGEGALGCVLGYGALHRIPAPLTEPSTGPGETMFESGADANHVPAAEEQGTSAAVNFLVPANMDSIGTSTASAEGSASAPLPKRSAVGKAKKARAHPVPASGLDDYFAEGEQKSRELEGGTPKPNPTGLPPPPKGGPPKASSPTSTARESSEAEG